MCEPTTIALIASAAVSAVGAGMQKKSSDKAVVAQAEAVNSNTSENYRVAQSQSRAADAQAFEQMTDRTRAAAHQLSVARVVAAQGGGSLAARAININAAMDEDASRIQAGLDNVHSSVRDTMAATETGAAATAVQATTALQANNTQLYASLAGTAIKAGGTYYGQQAEADSAHKWRKDYEGKRAEPPASIPVWA